MNVLACREEAMSCVCQGALQATLILNAMLAGESLHDGDRRVVYKLRSADAMMTSHKQTEPLAACACFRPFPPASATDHPSMKLWIITAIIQVLLIHRYASRLSISPSVVGYI